MESASVRHKKKQQETKTQRINQAKQVRNGKRESAGDVFFLLVNTTQFGHCHAPASPDTTGPLAR